MNLKMFLLVVAALAVFCIASGIAAPPAEEELGEGTCNKENEFYKECSTVCDDKHCDGREVGSICPTVCDSKHSCLCIEGTMRDAHGNCVKPDKCSKSIAAPPAEEEPVEGTCNKENEFYKDCATVCDDKYCDGRENNSSCATACDPKNNCLCGENTMRDYHGNCVKRDECYKSI